MHRDAPLTPTTLASPGPQLPNETLHTIFAHLAGSPPALVAILRTCHHFRLIAERILYASIAIAEALPCAPSPVSESDPVSTSSLVHASVLTASTSSASSTSTLSYDPKSESESALPSMHTATCARTLLARPHLSEVVRMLSIRWHTDRDLAPSSDLSYAYLPAVLALLNRALRSLHHLEQLELAFGLAGAPLDAHAVLAGCAFSSLRAFALSGLSPSHASPKSHADPAPTPSPSPSLSLDAALSAFLSRTPSLTHLRLPDCHSPLALSPSALPLLQDFRGPAPAAASVLPGRRVARLALVGREPYVSARDLAGLARAAGPVRVLDLGGMSVSPLLLRDLAGVCCLGGGGGGGVEEIRVRLALRHTLHHALSGIVSAVYFVFRLPLIPFGLFVLSFFCVRLRSASPSCIVFLPLLARCAAPAASASAPGPDDPAPQPPTAIRTYPKHINTEHPRRPDPRARRVPRAAHARPLADGRRRRRARERARGGRAVHDVGARVPCAALCRVSVGGGVAPAGRGRRWGGAGAGAWRGGVGAGGGGGGGLDAVLGSRV